MFSDNFEARDESPGNDTLIFNPSLIPELFSDYGTFYTKPALGSILGSLCRLVKTTRRGSLIHKVRQISCG